MDPLSSVLSVVACATSVLGLLGTFAIKMEFRDFFGLFVFFVLFFAVYGDFERN